MKSVDRTPSRHNGPLISGPGRRARIRRRGISSGMLMREGEVRPVAGSEHPPRRPVSPHIERQNFLLQLGQCASSADVHALVQRQPHWALGNWKTTPAVFQRLSQLATTTGEFRTIMSVLGLQQVMDARLEDGTIARRIVFQRHVRGMTRAGLRARVMVSVIASFDAQDRLLGARLWRPKK